MPYTHSIDVIIDNATCELGNAEDLGLRYSYALEDPENFESKQGGMALDLTLPATPTNDKIFNTFHDPNVEDMSIGASTSAFFTLANPGHSYLVGEVDNVVGGTILAVIQVTAVDGAGGIVSFIVLSYGTGYMPGTVYHIVSVNGSNATLLFNTSSGGTFTNPRNCQIIINGITLLNGKALLKSASHTRLPEDYLIDCYNQNGDWIIDGRYITLWDCLNTTPHNFDVATVEASWDNYDSDEFHDYTYAPVRYRQPFGPNDDAVNIYHLRPSISKYWLLFRFFRLLGYSLSSDFLNTPYFRGQVLPWTWGDFYDIDSQITQGMAFKAVGPNTPTTLTVHTFWPGDDTDPNNTKWATGLNGVAASGLQYVMNSVGAGPTYCNFRINQTTPPNGYDNFNLYSFDDTTATMIYTFVLPAALATAIGNNVTAHFQMGLIALNTTSGGDFSRVVIEITHIPLSGPTVVTHETFLELDLGSTGTAGSLLYPTIHNFYVSNLNQGDILKFRLQSNVQSAASSFQCNCANLINVNPAAALVSGWYYDPTTQQWQNTGITGALPSYQQQYSSLTMVGLLLAIGSPVHFQWYDKFRSYALLDMLQGLVDEYNLSIQTDPITRVVTIEPTNDYVLPDGTKMDGYFKRERIDWSTKQDLSQTNTVDLFADFERQYDFSFKGDGSDGGLNIFSARYKAAYMNNKIATSLNNLNSSNNDNGIISAIPGASRYMFPTRFQRGTRSLVNRFFSATMHYKHTKWNNIGGFGGPAPQLIAIIPENINDSSADAVTQTFEPKSAFYAGKQAIGGVGGWRWQGDPVGRGYDANGVAIPTYNDVSDQIPGQPLSVQRSVGFELPYMFAVDYSGWVASVPGQIAPVLTYSDQNINGAVQPGLMKTFYLKRLATIRNGKQYKPWMRLELGDIIDWEHRNAIIINGAVYSLIGIDNYNPIADESCQCTLWKVVNPDANDVANCFPSNTSILTSPTILPQFDLKYAQLLLFPTDLPQT